MTDKYDEQARELLPCEWKTTHGMHDCTSEDKTLCRLCALRPGVAAALRELGDENEKLRRAVNAGWTKVCIDGHNFHTLGCRCACVACVEFADSYAEILGKT